MDISFQATSQTKIHLSNEKKNRCNKLLQVIFKKHICISKRLKQKKNKKSTQL